MERTAVAKVSKTASAASAGNIDPEAMRFFNVNSQNDLKLIVKRSTIKLQKGFTCFPDGDPLNDNVKAVKPIDNYFDVALHGSPKAVAFGSDIPNMSARLLAAVIRHSDGYTGQKIRLLSCNTGMIINGEYCFAEELANALGVEVKAPNDVLYISSKGNLAVGDQKSGQFVSFMPNQRRRIK